MGAKTGIEWCDSTWNPLRGCSRVSEGCRHCYAETMAGRFSGPGQPYEGLAVMHNGKAQWTGKVALAEKHLLDPLKWQAGRPVYDLYSGEKVGVDRKRPRRIFVNSMSDLFHPNVPDEWIDRIFAVMALCPQHDFLVLTKRPERMPAYIERSCGRIADIVMKMRKERGDRNPVAPLSHVAPGAAWWPLSNVWLGVSVENQAAADERIPLLLQTPAAVRFISAEPLLGPVELTQALSYNGPLDPEDSGGAYLASLRGVDWVIAGGESGPGARPMHPDWARSLRDQCQAAAVSFFMKQMGSVYGPSKGHELPDDLDIKQFPAVQP